MTDLLNNYRESYEQASVFPQQLDRQEVRLFASLVTGTSRRILDIGCAEGRLCIELAQQGHPVVASDISSGQLENLAASSSNRPELDITAVQCDIEESNAPLQEKGPFDYVFLMDVIEHLRSPISALAAIRPLLGESGTLVIHTPNTCTLRKFLRYFLQPWKQSDFFKAGHLFDFHISSFDYMALEKLLNFTGFKITRIVPTRLSAPGLERSRVLAPLFRLAAKLFPLLGDTLLVTCSITAPVNTDTLQREWERELPTHTN